jgi:hypothetical protein
MFQMGAGKCRFRNANQELGSHSNLAQGDTVTPMFGPASPGQTLKYFCENIQVVKVFFKADESITYLGFSAHWEKLYGR